jgi:chemotaxis signal transduction protein
MDPTEDREDFAVDTGRALLFTLGDRQYALPVASVAGLAECGPVHKVPRAPRAVHGLAEWRGHVMTVIDLPHLLGHALDDEPSCLVRLDAPMQQIALLAPAALRTTSLPSRLDEVEESPARHALAGRFDHEGRSVRLIDPVALVRLAQTSPRRSV